MGRLGLLNVCGYQRRHCPPGRALRVDDQPQLPRSTGSWRTHASDVAGDGRGSRRERPLGRRAPAPRRAERLESAPMDKFTRLTAKACPLDLPNVNTDQILPARFLKVPRSAELGRLLFYDLRRDAGGAERLDFSLNQPVWRDAKILLAGRNFGSGSSREAAVYALYEAGIRCVIAPSFGDIFAENAVKNGLLAAILPESESSNLSTAISTEPAQPLTVDLEYQTVICRNRTLDFSIDPVSRNQLLDGWDDVDLTGSYEDKIAAFKAADRSRRPWARPGD